jgi:cytoskeleton protein RodZ
MPLIALGNLLREERCKRDLSVEDIAKRFKINPGVIRDVEAGVEVSVANAVYVRGFIRAYASLLDIPPEQIAPGLAEFIDVKQCFAATAPLNAPPRRSGGRGGLLLLPLLCAVAFGGYWYYTSYVNAVRPAAVSAGFARSGQPEEDAPGYDAAREVPPTPEMEASGVAPDVVPGPESGASVQNAAPISSPAASPTDAGGPAPEARTSVATSSVSPVSPVSSETPQEPVDAAQASAEAGQASDSAGQASEDAPVRARGFADADRETPVDGRSQGDGLVRLGIPGRPDAPAADINQLVLRGLEECWVHATADKTEMREFSLRPGETFSLAFRRTMLLKLGNAGGVRLQYNGRELPAPGKSGQVVTLTFP